MNLFDIFRAAIPSLSTSAAHRLSASVCRHGDANPVIVYPLAGDVEVVTYAAPDEVQAIDAAVRAELGSLAEVLGQHDLQLVRTSSIR